MPNGVCTLFNAAAEAPGGAGVPNRVCTSERRDPVNSYVMRPPKRLEAPACRTGSEPLNDTTR